MAASTQYTQDYQKAVTAYIQGNYDQAAAIVDALVSTRPDDPNIRLLRGHIYCCQEQYEPAQVEYQLVLSLTADPDLINCANESISKTSELLGGSSSNGTAMDWDADELTGLQENLTMVQAPAVENPEFEPLPADLDAEFDLLDAAPGPAPVGSDLDFDPFAISSESENEFDLGLGDFELENVEEHRAFDPTPGPAEELDSENEFTMFMPETPGLEPVAAEAEAFALVEDVDLDNLDDLFGDPLAAAEIPAMETDLAGVTPGIVSPSDDFGDLGDLGDFDLELENVADLSNLEDFGSLESFGADFGDLDALEDIEVPDAVASPEAEAVVAIPDLGEALFAESGAAEPEPEIEVASDEALFGDDLSLNESASIELAFGESLPQAWAEELSEAADDDLGFGWPPVEAAEPQGQAQAEPVPDESLPDFFAEVSAQEAVAPENSGDELFESAFATAAEADAALFPQDAPEVAVFDQLAAELGRDYPESWPEPEAVADLLEFTADADEPLSGMAVDLGLGEEEFEQTAFLDTTHPPTPEAALAELPALEELTDLPAALAEDEDLFGDFSENLEIIPEAEASMHWETSEQTETLLTPMHTSITTGPTPSGDTFADPEAEANEFDLDLEPLPDLSDFEDNLDLPVRDEFSGLPLGQEIPMSETFAVVPEDLDLSAELGQLPDLDFASEISAPTAVNPSLVEDLSSFAQQAPVSLGTSATASGPKTPAVTRSAVATPLSSDAGSSFSQRNTKTAITVGIVSALASGLVVIGLNQGKDIPNALLGGLAGGLAGGVASLGLGRRTVSHIKRCTTDLQAQFNAVMGGDMSATATVFAQDELGQLATSFNTMTQSMQSVMAESQQKAEENERQRDDLQRQVIRLLDDVEGAARGDLTVQAEVTADVLGAVADSFNLTIFNLRKIVQQVKVAARLVNKGATENETFARSLSSDALRQAEELAVTLNSVQMMTNAIQRVAESAKEANMVARNATEAALRGGEAVERTVAGILQIRETVAETTRKVKHLAESSQEISKIVGLISQISARTNLLALNASIEAARAGESGKGFAIVADEVRQLADRAAKSSKEIEQIVLQIQSETGAVMTAMEEGTQQVIEGTKRAEQAKHSLEDIIQVSSQIDQLVRSITSATVEQTETARSMAQVMQSVELTAQATSQEAQRVSDSLHNLVTVARDLQSSVERFRVEQTEQG